MGLSRDVPPVPNGTMVWDGHLGLSHSWWYNGIIPGCPTCTKWYNGTGWTLGIEPLWLVQWVIPAVPPVPNGTMVQDGHLGLNPTCDYPGMSHLYQMVQWYGMDTWD